MINPFALVEVAGKGWVELVEYLLLNGISVGYDSESGTTPLHNVAQNGQLHVAKILIDSGADIDVVDQYNRTVLSGAVSHVIYCKAVIPVIKYLLKFKSVISHRRSGADYLLLEAAGSGNLELVKIFLNLGANIEVRKYDDETPFHCAGSREVTKYLYDLGANIEAKNDYGEQN